MYTGSVQLKVLPFAKRRDSPAALICTSVDPALPVSVTICEAPPFTSQVTTFSLLNTTTWSMSSGATKKLPNSNVENAVVPNIKRGLNKCSNLDYSQ